MEPNKYTIFLEVAKQQNLSKAAQSLGYTQSGISHTLKRLEKETGLMLFERNRSGASLTKAGQEILPYVVQMVRCQENLNQAIQSLHNLHQGSLTIGTYSSISRRWLPHIIREFQQDYPSIRIDFMEGGNEDILRWIEEGEADLGFLSGCIDSHTEWIPLAKDPLMAVLPADHPYADLLLSENPHAGRLQAENPHAGRPQAETSHAGLLQAENHHAGLLPSGNQKEDNQSEFDRIQDKQIAVPVSYPLSEFNGQVFIISAPGIDVDIHATLEDYHIKPDIRYSAKDDFTIVSMVACHLGVSILPRLVLESYEAPVITLPLEPAAFRTLGIALSSRKTASPATLQFIEYTKAFIERTRG